MERDILAQINKDSHKFSKSQRKISAYISSNYDKAAFMTAGKLGETVGVSESTVVRFATDLGYDGYPGMRRAMQDMVRNRLTAVQRIEVARQQIDGGNLLDTVLSSDIEKRISTAPWIRSSRRGPCISWACALPRRSRISWAFT